MFSEWLGIEGSHEDSVSGVDRFVHMLELIVLHHLAYKSFQLVEIEEDELSTEEMERQFVCAGAGFV